MPAADRPTDAALLNMLALHAEAEGRALEAIRGDGSELYARASQLRTLAARLSETREAGEETTDCPECEHPSSPRSEQYPWMRRCTACKLGFNVSPNALPPSPAPGEPQP